MKNFFLLCLFVASLLTTTAMAQVSKIPADTRLYLQKVETSNNKACARSSERAAVTPKEAKLFVSCTPGADTKAIKARLKAIGAHPQGTIGRYIMVSTPVGVVDQIAAIEGVTFISRGPSVSQKTLVSREVTGVSKILTGTSPLPQAFTGKDVVVGIIDAGFDFSHPAFKDAEGAVDLVLHLDIVQQILAGAHLLRDQLGGDILQIIDRRFLGDAEGNLIGELIERARGLGALAVQSAHRQTELAEVRADTVDDAGHPERRKMEHH